MKQEGRLKKVAEILQTLEPANAACLMQVMDLDVEATLPLLEPKFRQELQASWDDAMSIDIANILEDLKS